MLAILNVVLPVFVVVGVGYAATRRGVFDERSIDGLMQFVIRFAVPALLFNAMYRLELADAFEWRMIGAFYVAAFACFALTLTTARRFGKRPGEAVAIAFGAFFSNTLLIGLPIMIRAYGEAATEPMLGIIAFHAPVIYAVGMVAMEVSRRDGAGAMAALQRAGKNIATNGLTIGIVAGMSLNLLGVRLPVAVEDAAALIASASLPTALFALGAALTRYRFAGGDIGWALGVSAVSLLLHPFLAWAITAQLLGLEMAFVRAAVVTAAMPAGLNAYLFAAMYSRAEAINANAVLLSTLLSVLTISFWLAMLGGAG